MIGIPIGPPSQSPEPKSAWTLSPAPIAATIAAELGATGSLSTRWFQGLVAGKTGQAGACGSRAAEATATPEREHAEDEQDESSHRSGDAATGRVLSSGSVTSG